MGWGRSRDYRCEPCAVVVRRHCPPIRWELMGIANVALCRWPRDALAEVGTGAAGGLLMRMCAFGAPASTNAQDSLRDTRPRAPKERVRTAVVCASLENVSAPRPAIARGAHPILGQDHRDRARASESSPDPSMLRRDRPPARCRSRITTSRPLSIVARRTVEDYSVSSGRSSIPMWQYQPRSFLRCCQWSRSSGFRPTAPTTGTNMPRLWKLMGVFRSTPTARSTLLGSRRDCGNTPYTWSTSRVIGARGQPRHSKRGGRGTTRRRVFCEGGQGA